MSPPKPYTPIDLWPDISGSAGVGPLQMQEDGDQVLWHLTWRADRAIVSISNTTPAVVTTSTAHRFTTGDAVRIIGSDATAINGDWTTITVLTSTTFALGGSVAVGAGTALGTVQNAKLGLFGKIVDGLAYLGKRLFGTPFSTGPVSIQGRKQRRPRVVLSDADHTIDVGQGDVFELSSAPNIIRTIKLRQTTNPIPMVGESIEIVVGGILATGPAYHIKREDGLLLFADLYGSAAPDVTVSARFDFEIPIFNVSSTDNATPIEVTTQEAHVFVTGNTVTIAGCSDANANGSHLVTRTGANTFTLTGTTADGGGSGGTATGPATWRLGPNSGGGAAGGVLAGPGA